MQKSDGDRKRRASTQQMHATKQMKRKHDSRLIRNAYVLHVFVYVHMHAYVIHIHRDTPTTMPSARTAQTSTLTVTTKSWSDISLETN